MNNIRYRWDSMTARKDDTSANEAASASENTVEEDDDDDDGQQTEESQESAATDIPSASVNGSLSVATVDVGHFQGWVLHLSLSDVESYFITGGHPGKNYGKKPAIKV